MTYNQFLVPFQGTKDIDHRRDGPAATGKTCGDQPSSLSLKVYSAISKMVWQIFVACLYQKLDWPIKQGFKYFRVWKIVQGLVKLSLIMFQTDPGNAQKPYLGSYFILMDPKKSPLVPQN